MAASVAHFSGDRSVHRILADIVAFFEAHSVRRRWKVQQVTLIRKSSIWAQLPDPGSVLHQMVADRRSFASAAPRDQVARIGMPRASGLLSPLEIIQAMRHSPIPGAHELVFELFNRILTHDYV